MATRWDELKSEFQKQTADRTFQPCAHYDVDADALTFYFRNDPDHGQRLNSRVTVYYSDDTDELVGCRIKGVRSVLEDIGWFDVSIRHNKIKLDILIVAFHAVFALDTSSREVYRQIGEAAHHSDLDVEVSASN